MEIEEEIDLGIGIALHCHICGEGTDFCCERCSQAVCADCLVPFTQSNQVDYNLCQSCET